MNGRVLIVDDEPDVSTYLATALRANGYAAAVADGVESGFTELEKTRPDLIILDIMLPKESGISMYNRLKQDQATESIPVVIISGVLQEGGFDFRYYIPDETVLPPERFLEKPVDIEQFLKAVKELIASNASPEKPRDK